MVLRKRFIYVRPFSGEIKPNDLQLITDELSTDLKENEILCEAEYIGIDAGVKSQALHYPDGITMIGAQIARVTDSRNSRFPKGSHIYGKFGWQTHTVTNPEECGRRVVTPYVLPDFGARSISLGLGCLGFTGNTALFGMDNICSPNEGETIVVSAAAGGVGYHACQIAKLRGCRVVGIVGSDKKTKWLLNKLEVDAAVNYKSTTFRADLKLATPHGVDCYFDSVGGDVSVAVMRRMNRHGRIAVCGDLAYVNIDQSATETTRATSNVNINSLLAGLQLRMEGFDVWDWSPECWLNGIAKNLKWMDEQKVTGYETVLEGFERAPEALINLLRGQYKGRVVIKIIASDVKQK